MIRRRAPIKRTRLKREGGAKAERERPALDRFRAELEARCGGWCEAGGVRDPETGDLVCGSRREHRGLHPHHVWPEDRDVGLHDPARGKWLCATSHRWAHSEPARAKLAGLLRPEEATA